MCVCVYVRACVCASVCHSIEIWAAHRKGHVYILYRESQVEKKPMYQKQQESAPMFLDHGEVCVTHWEGTHWDTGHVMLGFMNRAGVGGTVPKHRGQMRTLESSTAPDGKYI